MAAATGGMRTIAETRGIISAAMGDMPADTILENCRLVSVYTGRVIPDTQVAIHRDRISYVGSDASHACGPETKIIDAGGMYAAPGLADPHTHIDQFVMPSELAPRALLHGVTTLFSDPIDVTSVAGRRGFEAFVSAGRGLPIRIFHTVPGGLPVDPAMSRCGSGDIASSIRSIVKDNADVPGVGEVFAWTKVTGRDPRTIQMISDMTGMNCVINGHTAGASGRKLAAYAASGIISCHEPIDYAQAEERLEMGMWVMIREGSIRRDMHEIIPRIVSGGAYVDRLMFCSDGISPADITKYGYLDYCIRESVKMGIGIADAIIMASRNVFDYYMMGRDLGGIAPGRLADIILFEDADDFRPHTVMVEGQTAVSAGRLVAETRAKRTPAWIKKTVHIPRMSAGDFEVRPSGDVSSANTIVLKTEIITGMGSAKMTVRDDGTVVPHKDETDIWKVAAFDRNSKGGGRAVAFLQGLGGEVGAFASTWSFHENYMIVIGSDDAEMARAANHLASRGGGVAVSHMGRIIASMPLQFAGVVSTASFDAVSEQVCDIEGAMSDAGCRFARPILIPLFLPFLALPSVRMTSRGIVDVRSSKRVEPFSAS